MNGETRTYPKVPGINGNPLIPSIGASPNRVSSGSKLPTFRKSAPKRVVPTSGHVSNPHMKASGRSRITFTPNRKKSNLKKRGM